MALLQLVAEGAQDRVGVLPRVVRDLPEVVSQDRLEWGSSLTYRIEHDADILSALHLEIKVGPAPPGYRWKQLWPLHFVASIGIRVGGLPFWEATCDSLRMKYLMDQFSTKQEWSPLPIRAPQDTLFDYSDPLERERRSRSPCTVCFEPISLKDSIHHNYGIPLVKLAFHDVDLYIRTGHLRDCLEPIHPDAQLQDVPIMKCSILKEVTYLDRDERRLVAQTNYEPITKHGMYRSRVFEIPEDGLLPVYYDIEHSCSSAYLWITDEDGNELPNQVLENLSIYFNGQLRSNHSGIAHRHLMRQQLPHYTVDNNISQNMYYISYYSGRREENGYEQGANFRRMDQYHMKLQIGATVPRLLRIHTLHRAQNMLHFAAGMGILRYTHDPVHLFHEQIRKRPVEPKVEPVLFPNTDQLIDVGNEGSCLITWVDFVEGELIQQCLVCKKCMNSEALDKWITARDIQQCIHCRQPYNATTFRKGKAHLQRVVQDQRGQALLPNAAIREEAQAQEHQPHGFLGRMYAALGLNEVPRED